MKPIVTVLTKLFLQNRLSTSVIELFLLSITMIFITYLVTSFCYRRKIQKLNKLIKFDASTGLRSHEALKEYLPERIAHYNRHIGSFSLILIDIDNLKNLNSKHGYNTTDSIIVKVAELLNKDKRVTDEIFRKYAGGDEFIIITNDTSLKAAEKAADRKRKLINEAAFQVNKKQYKVTISCGVAEFRKNEDDSTSLTNRANDALLLAKGETGKNCIKSIV